MANEIGERGCYLGMNGGKGEGKSISLSVYTQ